MIPTRFLRVIAFMTFPFHSFRVMAFLTAGHYQVASVIACLEGVYAVCVVSESSGSDAVSDSRYVKTVQTQCV